MTCSLHKAGSLPEAGHQALRAVIALAVLALLLPRGLARAQSSSGDTLEKRPRYQTVRYLEDWSTLRDAPERGGPFASVKYVPLGPPLFGAEQEESYLSLGADARARSEYFANARFGAGPPSARRDAFLLQRYMLHADLHLGPPLRVFGQLQSSHATGRTGGPRPTDRDDAGVHQLFVTLAPLAGTGSGGGRLALRAGRQEIPYGDERLVSLRNGPNVRRSFDALRLIAERGAWRADLVAGRPVEIDVGAFDNGRVDPEETFWAARVVRSPGEEGAVWGPLGQLDLFYLGQRRTLPYAQGRGDETRHTVGLRATSGRTLQPFDVNVEAALQGGRFDPAGGSGPTGDVRAAFAALDAGYTASAWPLAPRLGVSAHAASGDGDPSDPDLQTFAAPYPNNRYFSGIGLYGGFANLLHVQPVLSLRCGAVRARLGWHVFWRASTQDAGYGASGRPLRTGSSNARFLGSQPLALVFYQMSRHVRFKLEATHFIPGAFTEETGPAPGVDYVGLEVALTL